MADAAGARLIVPVHHQSFRLSSEPFTEPIERIQEALAKESERLAMTAIGQTIVVPRMTLRRRDLLMSASGALLTSILLPLRAAAAVPKLRLTGVELRPVRATSRTVWLFVRLVTDAGLVGLGEASDAFGFANTTSADAARMRAELDRFFALVEGRSPFEIESYRQRGESMARQGLVPATAFSAIEQAMWDLAGKALDVPTYVLLGGKVRTTIPVYANINRATNPRTPDGFAAAARRAVADGFRAIKAAPFDGFPPRASGSRGDRPCHRRRHRRRARAMRAAVGPSVAIMIDCHSFFDVEQSVAVADRLAPYDLTWYEEPVPPERVDDTVAIRRRIKQPMAGGEVLFGLSRLRIADPASCRGHDHARRQTLRRACWR